MAQTQEYVPKWIAWEVIRKCNLRCVHCRSSSDETSLGEVFDTREAKKLLSEIAADYRPVVVLTGGEPLLRRDLFEIARFGTDLGLRMCLATNGTLVTDDVCTQIKAAAIKMVSLSLDGASAEVHDDFRQQVGAFEGTLRAAEHFRRHDVPFLVNSSFTKRNQDDIPKTYKLAKEIGATAWYMFMIVPTGRGEEVMEELISAEDYDEILNWHYDTERGEEELLMRPTCAPHYYRIVLQRQKVERDKWRRRSLTFSTGGGKGCIAAQSICFIDVEGNVLPCSYFSESAGNVRRQPFREIWETSELFADLRDFSRYKDRCGACEYLNVCGGCRARAHAVSGDYLAQEPFCTHIPLRMNPESEREGARSR
jgi:radical SAM protein with 4Fe4S-binding SPASM domain